MTPKQYQLFTFIRNYITHVGHAPTFSEMKKHMKVSSNQTIGDWLSILEREKYISRNKAKLRGITLTEKGTKGFDEIIRVQKQEFIKNSFSQIYGTASSTNLSMVSVSQNHSDNGIIINANTVVPEWKGGEKNGSS